MFYRSIIGRRLTAAIGALAIASIGVHAPLAAAAQAKPTGASSATLAQQVARLGASAASATAPANLERMRREALVQQSHPNPRTAARARRTLVWLDIVGATTGSERHEKIRQLPVTVVRSQPGDGTAGTLVQFVARGKTRLQWMTPVEAPAARGIEPSSGPSDRLVDECYDGPEPCATQQEMDDLGMAIADTLAEADSQEQELDYESAEHQNWCNQNPGACDLPGSTSGPSADALENCVAAGANAVVAVAGAVATAVLAEGAVSPAIAAGKTLTKTGWGALIVGVFAAGYAAGTFVSGAIQCYTNRTILPIPFVFDPSLSRTIT